MIEFGATVNDETRRVYLGDSHFTTWILYAVKVGKADDDILDEIESHVMNDELAYRDFYNGSTDEDYDAELTDRYAEWDNV